MSSIPEGGESVRCLLVQTGDYVCALPLVRVQRVVRALTVHPLPGAAAELLGLAEFGGEPLPVLDLGRLVGAPPGANPAAPVTIVARVGPAPAEELAGLAADAALDIVELPLGQLAGSGGALVRGEVVAGGQPTRLLDLAAIGGEA
jgi:purine-binding chemotaxis protein CheW